MQVNVLEAKTRFSKLLEAVSLGEDVVIANRGTPVARIVKYAAPKVLRKPGAWAHIVQPDGYDDFNTANLSLRRALDASNIFAHVAKQARSRKASSSIKNSASRKK